MSYNEPIKYETKVFVFQRKPSAATIVRTLNDFANSVDTEMSEWEVDLETKANTGATVYPANAYRWELKLTRRIK